MIRGINAGIVSLLVAVTATAATSESDVRELLDALRREESVEAAPVTASETDTKDVALTTTRLPTVREIHMTAHAAGKRAAEGLNPAADLKTSSERIRSLAAYIRRELRAAEAEARRKTEIKATPATKERVPNEVHPAEDDTAASVLTPLDEKRASGPEVRQSEIAAAEALDATLPSTLDDASGQAHALAASLEVVHGHIEVLLRKVAEHQILLDEQLGAGAPGEQPLTEEVLRGSVRKLTARIEELEVQLGLPPLSGE